MAMEAVSHGIDAKTELADLLETMDIPSHRKDVESKNTLRWLQKNLGTRNSERIGYDRAVLLIDLLLTNKYYIR